ncbi:MAG: OmpA family protein [Desulfamplus sp.]|nr:OmpA family protein [Desulfamplus sp.]
MKEATSSKSVTLKSVLTAIIVIFSLSLMAGCSVGLEKGPAYRTEYSQYPPALIKADLALEEARRAGKDSECPEEFNELKAMVDRAYEIYDPCIRQAAIDMAEAAIIRINALCPMSRTTTQSTQVYYEPKVVTTTEGVTVLAFEDIHFDFDKSTLTPEAQAILKRNIQMLKDNPQSEVRIAGYTSASGTDEYNQSLSERRATSVRQYLINEGIITPDRLTKIGYGEDNPAMYEPLPKEIYSPEAKANMRVLFEIIVK